MTTLKLTSDYWRNPTPFELKQGYGAIHWKTFSKAEYWNYKKDRPKKWLICQNDGLRYNL